MTYKRFRDCYKRSQEKSDKRDNCDRRMLRIVGEVGEMEELFMEMREESDDILAQKACDKTAQRKRDDEKYPIGT